MGREEAGRGFRPEKAGTDLLGGAILAAIALVFLGAMGRTYADWIFPRVITYTLLIIGAYLFVKALIELAIHHREFRIGVPSKEALTVARDVIFLSVIMVLDVFLQRYIGFWVSSFLMLSGASLYLSAQKKGLAVPLSLLAAVLTCAVAYGIFTVLFSVSFPMGKLFGF